MSIGRRIWLSQSLIILGLVLFTALAFWTARSVEAATTLRQRAFLSFVDTQALLTDLQDAETGQRGYLLTGNPIYLDPYERVAKSACARPAVSSAEEGDPVAFPALAAHLTALCKAKMAELAQTISLRRQSGLAAALAVVNTDRGKMLMDNARASVALLQAMESHEIEYQDATIVHDQDLHLIILCASLLLAAIIVINGALVVRAVRRPLAVIQKGIGRIAEGDLSAEAPIVGDHEFLALARSFNDMAGQLRGERAERARAQSEVASTARVLSARTADLERRTLAIDLVGEMANRLLGARDEAEFAEVVERYAPRLLPGTRGALYSITDSRANVRQIGAWEEPVRSAPDFAPDDCWAIRRGRPHVVATSSNEVVCRHVESEWRGAYSCLPLVAQGETVGLLHIEDDAGADVGGEHERQVLTETIAASLVNLRLRDSLRDQSIRDPLSGLFNRRYLEEAFELECSRAGRSMQPLSVLMADIDHFKQFNDAFGHEAGDTVLKQFSEILKRSVRRGDIVCRIGGEEFFLVLPSSNIAAAGRLAERVRQEVAGFDFTHRGRGLGKVTVSIGVASYPADGDSPAALMSAADKALYVAKDGGRDRVATSDRGRHALAVIETV